MASKVQYGKVGARVKKEHHEQIKQFCDKNGISQSELFLDGLAVMMGQDARVYEKVNQLQEEVDTLSAELLRLKSRGFLARLFNSEV